MKIILSIILVTVAMFTSTAQEITGQWNGELDIQGIKLRLIIHVEEKDDQLISKMDSPDQGAMGIPITKTTFESPNIKFEIPMATIEYSGEVLSLIHI